MGEAPAPKGFYLSHNFGFADYKIYKELPNRKSH